MFKKYRVEMKLVKKDESEQESYSVPSFSIHDIEPILDRIFVGVGALIVLNALVSGIVKKI